MKKYIKYNVLGFILVLFTFVSCDDLQEAHQDASDIISPNGKPTVTITSDLTGDAIEGQTITYTITLSQTLDHKITFTPSIIGGTADDHDYEALEPVTIESYTNSIEFPVVITADYLVEEKETLRIQLEILGVADRYLIHPDTVIAPLDINIAIADPTLLTINFAWNEDIDFDILVYSDTATYPAELWGTGGATGANPEIDHSIWLEDPKGDYYVCILDWGEGINFNYTFTLAYPDNSVQIITGTFDGTNYPYTSFTGPAAWGSPSAYKILKVVNDGTKFVVTKL